MPDIKAGVVGATGYVGAELIRLLVDHPYVELTAISSSSSQGVAINEIYPNFSKISHLVMEDENAVIEKCDVIFAALPHGLSQSLAEKTVKAGKFFIDMGADFRLESEEEYKEWYGGEFDDKKLHSKAVYGLCELFREDIENTNLVANPGCYPTSIALGLYPALDEKLIKIDSIIIDSKSGTTGAGKGLSQTTHFPDCNENFAPYKVAEHRHTPEIEQTLSAIAQKEIKVTFVPHLLPVNRGIESTIYANLSKNISLEEIHDAYMERYCAEDFVRVLPLGKTACIKNVKYSNYCDISIHKDERTNRLIIVSCIDNMVKGAAGQAVQNMNILFKLPEFTGLSYVPPAF